MRALRTLALAIAVMTGFSPAVAQQFPVVPDHSVIGRIGTGSGSGPSQAIPFGTFTASAGIAVSPSAFKAVGDGVTDDHVALQNWANSLRDGGVGTCNSALGYATSQTIVFTPSTNTGPVQGPVILGNCKFIGLSGLTSDLLRIWNPTAVTTSQNFYYPRFEALTLSNPNGSSAHCLSLRGFWGSIGQIFGTNCGGDVVNFPAYALGGISDEYESMATFGSVTGIGTGGAIIGNDMGSGASYTAGDVRGNTNTTLTAGTGLLRGTGSMSQSGALVYTGGGFAIQYVLPVAPAVVTPAHEVYSEGWGDLDCIQNGMKFEALRVGIISGHRMNVEPASGGACNTGTVIPQTAYSFGRTDQTGDVENLVVNAFVTVRPGVTFPAFTLIDFNNETNITNLTVNLSINDQTGTLAAQSFSTLYKNIHPAATVRIVQNGVVVYDTITNAVYLNPSAGFQTKLLPAPTANFTMTLPSTAGASGSFLQSVGGGTTPMTWLTPGTGVATALGVNVGTAGAVVVNGGALGTPSSGTATNITGLPISTGVSGLAAGIASWLATPTSANLATAITDETGSGALVFATSPALVTPALGTPASGVMTNVSGTAASLTAGHVTTNANSTGDVTSVGNATTYNNVVPAAKGGAGTITGALKGNGAGTVTQAACADLSNAAASCSTDATVASNISGVGLLKYKLAGVNFNSANTDNALTITLPSGVARYTIYAIEISNASHTLVTATIGLFSATGGGGTTIAANQAVTVSATADNTVNNGQVLTAAVGFTQTINFTSLQVRVGTAEGAAATGDVTVFITPL